MKKLKNPLFLKKYFYQNKKKRAVEFLHPLARMILVGLSLNVLCFLVILSVSEISHRTYAVLYSKGLPQSLRSFAMTVGFPYHRERKRGDPRE